MSTERSRQKAKLKSLKPKSASGKRKYHFSEKTTTDYAEQWRGIVLPPHYVRAGPRNVISNGVRYNVNGLFAHLLYWENVAIPRPDKTQGLPPVIDLLEYCHNRVVSVDYNDNLFSFGLPNEDRFSDQRFMNRKSVRRAEVLPLESLEWEHQVQTFRALESRDPGLWSIADPLFHHRTLRTGRSLMVRLYDAIPVPATGLTLLEVVEFKQKHWTELQALRATLADLFLKIENSKDSELGFRSEFNALKDTITSLTDRMEDSGFAYKYADLEVRLKWEFDGRLPLAASTAAALLHLQVAVAAAAGALLNVFPKIEVNVAPGHLPLGRKHPLAYACLISKEFGELTSYGGLGSKCFLKD